MRQLGTFLIFQPQLKEILNGVEQHMRLCKRIATSLNLGALAIVATN